MANQRPDLCFRIRWIPDHQLGGLFGNPLGQPLRDGTVGINPLHRHTDLPGMVEAGLDQER